MTRISAYQGYSIIGLAIELKDHLDQDIYDRLIHGGLVGISRSEAYRIERLLEDYKEQLAQAEEVAA